ncbi:MAG: glycoside hydrolase family 3 C-terminal domain-containing protein [Acidobacteriaceae bacterium]
MSLRTIPSLTVLCAGALFAVPSSFAQQSAPFPFQNPSLPIAQRVGDLVGRMTLEEKASQMRHAAPAIPRLGIPAYDWWSEGLHGIARSGYATVFPQAIGMAATWDPGLIHRVSSVIADEARAKNVDALKHDNHSIFFGLTIWSPNINIFRDPRWGRGQETYGEDPYLTSRLGVAFVEGLQGNDPKYFEAIATPKHYAVHSGPESERHRFNATPSAFDLEDTYLPAFRATITQAKADSIMCAYNALYGFPACASPLLLKQKLRGAWKFDGFVTSDCGAIGDFYSTGQQGFSGTAGHHFSPDAAHASATAVLAGTDTSCGDEYDALPQAVKQGLLPESAMDTALKRLFTARIRLGLFDPPSKVEYARLPFSHVDSEEHRALAREVAEKAMVLLKNEHGTLPLRNVKTLAVVGPNAESLIALEGNYNGVPSHPVLPLDGITTEFAGAHVLYAQGAPYVEGVALPVPRTALKVKGEYFANANFSGPPVLTRDDPTINFDWNASAPASGVPATAFSVRWTGTLSAPAPGDYAFSVDIGDCYPCRDRESYKVTFDGKVVANEDSGVAKESRGRRSPDFMLHFTDTQPHAIQLEYGHQSPLFGAGISLRWKPAVAPLREQAVAAATQADAVIAFVGLTSELEGEEMPVHVPGFAGGDRTEIELPAVQKELLESLAATGKPLVVVLLNGSALAVNWAQQHAAAILEAWYPGEEGGTAIAETLSGKNNPAGRLPLTFYASTDQLPPFDDYSMQNRTYRYFKGKPLYGFGYGLSYTQFAYSDVKLAETNVKAGEPLRAQVTVKNDGEVAGDEVAELYLARPSAQGNPVLRGMARVHLAAGASQTISFTLAPRDLSTVDQQGKRAVQPGEYSVMIGGAQPSAAEHVTGSFAVTGSEVMPE